MLTDGQVLLDAPCDSRGVASFGTKTGAESRVRAAGPATVDACDAGHGLA